jgi:hypothetical protein
MVDPSLLDKSGIGLDHITDTATRAVLECLFALRDRGEVPTEELLQIELSRRGYDRVAKLNVYAWATSSSDVAAIAARLRELSDARDILAVTHDVASACEQGRPDLAREHMRTMWDMRQVGTSETRVKSIAGVWTALGERLVNGAEGRDWPGVSWPTVDAQVRL